MAEIRNISNADIAFISTEIGRGHPSYLDGTIETLGKDFPDIAFCADDVFSVSHGVARRSWGLIRRLYRFGARGGAITAIYSRLRRGTREGRLIRILGRDLKRRLGTFSGPVVVAHPILARMLKNEYCVVYQHGELAVPEDAVVPGCHKILAPLREAADRFTRSGLREDDILVTGQCIEIDLVRKSEDAYRKRLARIGGERPLTAALFSSGAYPRDHLRLLLQAAKSLTTRGHKVYAFLGQSPTEAAGFMKRLDKMGVRYGTGIDEREPLAVIVSRNRVEENTAFASVFESVDFFVAPAHERTNWSVGLGLPQILLTPHIGSYAPLNAQIALERGTAVEWKGGDETGDAGDLVSDLRAAGKLTEMATNGFGRTDIDGFERSASFIAGRIRSKGGRE